MGWGETSISLHLYVNFELNFCFCKQWSYYAHCPSSSSVCCFSNTCLPYTCLYRVTAAVVPPLHISIALQSASSCSLPATKTHTHLQTGNTTSIAAHPCPLMEAEARHSVQGSLFGAPSFFAVGKTSTVPTRLKCNSLAECIAYNEDLSLPLQIFTLAIIGNQFAGPACRSHEVSLLLFPIRPSGLRSGQCSQHRRTKSAAQVFPFLRCQGRERARPQQEGVVRSESLETITSSGGIDQRRGRKPTPPCPLHVCTYTAHAHHHPLPR